MIEADHRLAVNEGHRCGPEAKLDELLERSLICPDVFDDKRDAVLRKELFLPIAGTSPGLRIDNHLFRHRRHLRPMPTSRFAVTPDPLERFLLHVPGTLYGIGQVRSTDAYEYAGRSPEFRHRAKESCPLGTASWYTAAHSREIGRPRDSPADSGARIAVFPQRRRLMGSLQSKVIIVTGASSGMGRSIATALAAEGAVLGLVARNVDRLEETAALARAKGGEVLIFPGDVADTEVAKRVVRELLARFGRIDILVNNAGTNTYHRNLADTSVEDWHRVMNTNITGAFLFTRQVLPHMRKAGKGQIINISSGAGLQPGAAGGVAYCASKHAMHSLNGSINLEERRHGIKACVIAPGETDTSNLDLRPRPPAQEDRAKMMRPEDIARAVIFAANQPDHVSVDVLVITPTVGRNYQADYERYAAEGHTKVPLD